VQEQSRKKRKKKKKLTQEELLAECAHTEVINTRSLQALLDIEEESKRKTQTKKRKESGALIRTYSYGGQSLYTFTDPIGLPMVFDGFNDPVPKPAVCAITGLPAKYKDPKTGQPYANAEAFKKLRAGHTTELATKETLQVAVAEV
jgi:vacuolar protein sorting-associated protein 72